MSAAVISNRGTVGQPAYIGQAFAYINISDINISGKDYPLRSSQSGLMYTVFFTGNDDPFSFSGKSLPQYCFDHNIELIRAGYCYRGNLVIYGKKGFAGFEKQLDKTEEMLMKTFEAAAVEPEKIEVTVPTIDWRFVLKFAAYEAFVVYLLAIISLVIVR